MPACATNRCRRCSARSRRRGRCIPRRSRNWRGNPLSRRDRMPRSRSWIPPRPQEATQPRRHRCRPRRAMRRRSAVRPRRNARWRMRPWSRRRRHSDVVEARAAKMLLHAPAAGTVAILVAEVGEAVVPGEPVLTLVPDNGTWFGFNLREDALHGLAIGSVVPVHASAQAEPISAQARGDAELGRVRGVAGGPRDRRSRPQHAVPPARPGHRRSKTGRRRDGMVRSDSGRASVVRPGTNIRPRGFAP